LGEGKEKGGVVQGKARGEEVASRAWRGGRQVVAVSVSSLTRTKRKGGEAEGVSGWGELCRGKRGGVGVEPPGWAGRLG
jgi:hypothetical protein